MTTVILIVVAAIFGMAIIVLVCSALGIGHHTEPPRHAKPGPHDTTDLANPADTTDPDGDKFIADIKADATTAAINTARPDHATLARVAQQLKAEQPPAGTPVNLGYLPRTKPSPPAWVTTSGQPGDTEADTPEPAGQPEPEPAASPPALIPAPAPQPALPTRPTFTPTPEPGRETAAAPDPGGDEDDPDITRAQLHAVRTWGKTPEQIVAELADEHLAVKL